VKAQLNAVQISGLLRSEYQAGAGCKAVEEAGVVEASLTRLEMKVDSVIEYLCHPYQRVASTQVADLGVPGHELQRQCDSAHTMQRAWRSRRLRRSQPAAFFKELHAAIGSETFSDKFTELVGSWCPLTLATDGVDVRERQLFTDKEVPRDQGSSTPPAGHAKGSGPRRDLKGSFFGKKAEAGLEKETDAKEAEEEFTFLEQHLDVCLEGMRESLASMRVPREQKQQENLLDDLSASGMAAIQSSVNLKSSQSKLMLYRHFRRLHASLRSRIANMMLSQRVPETATPTQPPSQSVARSSFLPLPFGLQGFQPKDLWK